MSDEGERAWAQAVAFTRDRSPASFDQWFSGVQFDSFTDGVLGLRARDEFVRQWVEDYFLPTISEWLRAHTGLSVQVRWIIDVALERPVADRPSSFAPVRPRAISVRPLADPSRADLTPQGTAVVPPTRVFAVPPPIEGLNAKYTFANFVVGPSNQLAHAASMAAAGVGGRRHNPLFICGGTGLGKTHLVHAIAHRVREERPDARIVYISAERFVNEFVQALTDQRMHEFRARYREKCDLLLVDDIHFLAGKTQTQEEFFHAFNALHQGGKQIVVTSDKYPQQLDKMEERLVSRFQWGLVADIQAPELETRVAIVRKKAQLEHIELADDVCLYIAQSVRSNVRELEGTLIRLAAKASLLGKPIDHRLHARRDRGHQHGPAERGERRGHPARRLPPLQAPLDRPALEGPPQEHRLRAARRDVPLQAAAEVQLPGARARVRQPRSHDGDQRGSQGRGPAHERSRGPRPPRGARAQARKPGVKPAVA